MYKYVQQFVKISQAFALENYVVLPLPDPKVNCYYFRNNGGIFAGQFEPYFYVAKDEVLLDHINYWEGWKQELSNFHILNVDAPNHFKLLSEPKAQEVIHAFCKKLYSAEGMSTKFLKSFTKKHGNAVQEFLIG